jgi:hypothetical protein
MNLHSNTADRQLILPGRPEITVQLRPSRRASRLSLRISRLKGQVTLSLPLSCPMAQAKSFILEKESWIRAHLADLPQVAHAGLDRQVPFAGRQLTIRPGAGRPGCAARGASVGAGSRIFGSCARESLFEAASAFRACTRPSITIPNVSGGPMDA